MSLPQEDFFIIGVAVTGIVLISVQLYLSDFNIMNLLFEKETPMKKAESIDELKVGQTIYLEEKPDNKHVIKSLEDKLVPYVIIEDHSSHSIQNGIWTEG